MITCLTVLASSFATPAAQANLFTYNFTGEVTDVSNPNGLFTGSASVGAAVTGSFTYTDSPNQGSFAFNDNFTNYSHTETPADTRMVLTVGGAAVHSSAASLSNMIIGNGNPSDEFPPYFPIGDSFRYVDTLDDSSTLFDFSQAELFQSASGSLFFVDSTGDLFDSQALPSGLAVSSFDSRFGLVIITDDNFEETGRLTFRIDSVQAVPEASTAAMLCLTIIMLVAWRRV